MQTTYSTNVSHPTMLVLMIDTSIDISNDEIGQIRDRIAQWQQLFSAGDRQYSLDGYEHLFSQKNNELLIYDNYAEKDTRWVGFDKYREIWEREINGNFPGYVMYRIEVDRIEVSGNLAWSACTWWGSVVKDGKTLYPAQHATHIWKKTDEEWAIVHEHLTSGVKENGKESMRSKNSDVTDEYILHHYRN